MNLKERIIKEMFTTKKNKPKNLRKRFLQWIIPLILPHHHIAGDPSGGGRKKKIIEQKYDEVFNTKKEGEGSQ